MGNWQPAPHNGARIVLSPRAPRCTRRRRPGSVAKGRPREAEGLGIRHETLAPLPQFGAERVSDRGSPRVAPRAGDSQFELRTVAVPQFATPSGFFFGCSIFFFLRPRTRLNFASGMELVRSGG